MGPVEVGGVVVGGGAVVDGALEAVCVGVAEPLAELVGAELAVGESGTPAVLEFA